tara:strand:- start:413 stop:2065 length:1653 start_codon:yes stop_codon:yes gene_type:complete
MTTQSSIITAKYDPQTREIVLDVPYEYKDRVKLVGALWNKKEKYWYFIEPTLPICEALIELNIVFSPALSKVYNELNFIERSAGAYKRAGFTDLPKDDTHILYGHQNQTRLFGKARGSYADLSDCGTGKTIATLSVINEYWEENNKIKVLVICPKSIIQSSWVADCNKTYPHLKIVPAVGTAEKKLEAFNSDANIYVTNYESMHTKFTFEEEGYDILVCDEAVRLKNPSAKWTKRVTALARIIPKRIIISGLITPNNLMEIYAPFNIVEPSLLGGSFYQFRHKYFTPNPWSYMNKEWVPKKKGFESITSKIERLVIRHKKDDCLDLPEKIYNIRKITMTREQKKFYDEMAKQFITEIEDKTITAVNAGAKLQKLSQITSGFVYHEDDGDKTFTEFHNAKNKELDSMLMGELADEQVIVYCTYKGEIAIFKEMYKDGAFIHGGQSVTSQQEAIQRFKDGDARILFANVQSAKYGLTFTNCSNVIYYSLSYSLDDLYQSQERIHRIGQSKTCNYTFLCADKSVDFRVYKAVMKKQGLNDMVYSMIEDIKGEK